MPDLDAFLEAEAAAHAHAKARGLGRGNGGAGEMECPVCQGTLKYTVESAHGLMWGACSTVGCISWMD